MEGKVELYDDLGWYAQLRVGEVAAYVRSIRKALVNEMRVLNPDTIVNRALRKPMHATKRPWIKPSLRPKNLPEKPVPGN